MSALSRITLLLITLLLFSCSSEDSKYSNSNPVREDPMVKMPGTQPGQVTLESSVSCYQCHGGGNGQWSRTQPDMRGRTNYDEYNIYKAWQGSMMGNSARDPLMFACFTVAAQDALFYLGSPNAVDICLRCHFPKGWLEGRSGTLNASAMTGDDYDGIQCTFCHRLTDPFFRTTFDGTREGSDWQVYWDEQNSPAIAPEFRSQVRALETFLVDQMYSASSTLFSGSPFFVNDKPVSPLYSENAGGQYFVSPVAVYRGPFADAFANGVQPAHKTLYSRYHKSKFICATCHDVSNPMVANYEYKGIKPGSGTALPTETLPAFAWGHAERTYSEFRLSAYNQPGGAPGKGNFKPYTGARNKAPMAGFWETDQPGNRITRCQDCHMCSRWSPATNSPDSPVRPEGSSEHPNTWLPCHAMTGGNVWMPTILGSIAPDNPNRDMTNVALLLKPELLTMDVMQGTWSSLQPPKINPTWAAPSITDALKLTATRNRGVLGNAANITDISFNQGTGDVSFRIQNNTGHKLISGFPEGRRMFVNIKAYQNADLVYEINPYDYTVGTLKGLAGSTSSPPLLPLKEEHSDELVYEVKLGSSISNEQETMHFALATHRYKDNRIPPKGFNISGAAARLSEPVWQGKSAPDYFTAAEYAEGYDQVMTRIPTGATRIEINLYYQSTSREYIEFLRNEINGTGKLTLPAKAYVIQSHPFFKKLKAWGDTIFSLWEHNKNVDTGKPYLMTSGIWTVQ